MLLLISSGTGPEECGWVVFHLLEKLKDEALTVDATISVIEAIKGVEGTYRSALLSVEGNDDWCRSLLGTIQWIGTSKFRPHHKRKNWFVSISLVPEPSLLPEMDERFLTFTAMRASGPGGQHINKVSSAVRVVHNTLGLMATSQEERSQHLNKKSAIAKLTRMIFEQNQSKLSDAEKVKWNYHNTLERGNAVRVYYGDKFERR